MTVANGPIEREPELFQRPVNFDRITNNVPEEELQEPEVKKEQDRKSESQEKPTKEYKVEIVWLNVILMSLLHIGALIGLRLCFTTAKWQSIAFTFFMYVLGEIGITGGAHRLWAHRAYKAKTPLKILLAIMQTIAYQNSIYEWSRDHRVHHKYSETNADPHNALRGFFFAHIGWLLCKKHPDVKEKGKSIDMSDLRADPIVMFQHRHYKVGVTLLTFVLPTLIPHLLWGESLYTSFYVCALLRYVINLHPAWFTNSAAHMWGRRPYDKSINPAENRFVSLVTLGEGFHNYHHTFPWDYAASELGFDLNLTKRFIDFFSIFGWAYDRKVVSAEMLKQRKLRTGDVLELGPYGPHN